MTLNDLGDLGNFVGAIGVIATLAYLAVQVRQNTHSLEAAQRLALAQTYQMRADALQSMVVEAAASPIGTIIVKLTEAGYPENLGALDTLTVEERGRFRLWQIAQQTHWDNMHYQYQQGFLDPEYYNGAFAERAVRLWPTWKALGITGGRKSFFEELERLSREG